MSIVRIDLELKGTGDQEKQHSVMECCFPV